jgi:hypothetical protein
MQRLRIEPLIYAISLSALPVFIACDALRESRVKSFVEDRMPELDALGASIDSISDGRSELALIVEYHPDDTSGDRYERDYYQVCVCEVQPDRSVRLNTLFVDHELREIRVYDYLDKEYPTIEEWRRMEQREYWVFPYASDAPAYEVPGPPLRSSRVDEIRSQQ